MKKLQRPIVRKLALLLLIPAMALGPFGCCGGIEAIPVILAVTATAGAVALTIHQFQQIESADLDNQMKRLQLRGMQDGRLTTFEHQLSDDAFQQIAREGKVNVNGVVIPVSR
jgi:heme O synthase-like polyprenyltransferase